jgi:hypothetical protein
MVIRNGIWLEHSAVRLALSISRMIDLLLRIGVVPDGACAGQPRTPFSSTRELAYADSRLKVAAI